MMKMLTTIVFTCLTVSAFAKETVTIIYGWSPSDNAANYNRTLVAEANRIQDKYTFIFDTKPGAGASIAAQYVLANPDTILSTSPAFWIRPNFFPNESHDVSKYRELMPLCDPAMHISSKKYQSWKDVPTDKPLSMGVSGLGTTSHLIALEITKKYPNITIIPFKSTTEAIVSVLSDVTDFSVNFNGDTEQYVVVGKLNVLGITGSSPDGKLPMLINNGFPKILGSISVPAHLIVPNSIPESKFKEWREILVKAARSEEVRASFTVDHCAPINQMPDNKIDAWFDKENTLWKGIASGVTLK